jgi:hypothetical protein
MSMSQTTSNKQD